MVKDLAAQMLMQQHGAVQLVDRLCTAGLVERTTSSKDRRIVLIALTETGGRVLASLAGTHAKALLMNEPLLQFPLHDCAY
ncbi:MarR family winged helix-turn-helix transcriptional regulator [Neorhizobium petrolearium]